MRIDSINLPQAQVSRDFSGADAHVESASNFQSANDNEIAGFAVGSQLVDPVEVQAVAGSGVLYSSGHVENRRRGRPRTRHWSKQRRINRKAVTKVIADPVVEAMLDGAQHAGIIKAPLNTFVTIRPANIDDVAPEKKSDLWQAELNRIQAFVRYHGHEPTYIWSRESRQGDGSGEHLHLLMHLPRKLMDRLRSSLEQRYSEPNEVDVRPASETATRASNGKMMSAVTYVVKALSPQARRKTSQPYRKSGPVVGKRAGMTRNIDVAAVAAHRARLNRIAA